MPDEPDERLVPPLKVMRKRLNGVYRADSGFSGPTRRYVLIVALLVGLASIPTLAAITAGSNELSDGKTDTMDVPFLPPASPGPVRTRPRGPVGALGPASAPAPTRSPGPASPSPSPSLWVPPSLDPTVPPSEPPPSAPGGSPAAIRLGRLLGQVGAREDRPAPDRDEHSAMPEQDTSAGHKSSSDHETSSDSGVVVHAGRSRSKHSTGSKKPTPSKPAPSKPAPAKNGSATSGDAPAGDDASDGDASDDSSGAVTDDPDQDPGQPDDPPARPDCHERGECGADPTRHHRPDFSRHRQCDSAHWSHHRTIHIDRTSHIDQSSDWSEHRRRSAVTERPQNVRPARVLERSFGNAGSYIPGARNPESRVDDNQIVNRSYRGNHRLAGQHHADRVTPAQQRDSRVGRHHADHRAEQDDYRW